MNNKTQFSQIFLQYSEFALMKLILLACDILIFLKTLNKIFQTKVSGAPQSDEATSGETLIDKTNENETHAEKS